MPFRVPSWTIPLAALAAALVLLSALHQRLPGTQGPRATGGEAGAIEAVRTAPADPFRYGGRTVAGVLARIEPSPGWTDLGWEATPRADGGYRVTRTFRGPSGARRAYRFRVGPDPDPVRPANDRARRLMDREHTRTGGREERGG